MKINKSILIFFIMLFSLILLFSCNEDEVTNPVPKNHLIKGYAQKGPFLQGSQISIQVLDNSLTPVGKIFETETINNLGYFEIPLEIDNQFLEIISTGFYFNEVSGNISNSQITLRSIISLSSFDTVSVNVLTTLSAKRIRHLVKNNNMKFDDAKTIAEQEVLEIFNINEPTISDFETMNITKPGKKNAVLLASSCILQGNSSVAQLSEFISKISIELENDGLQNDSTIADRLFANALNLNNHEIRSNLFNRYQSLGLDVPIPDFESYTKLLLPLTVIYTTPHDLSNSVSISTDIRVAFNKDMNPESINPNSFVVSVGAESVTGILSYDQYYRAAVFIPSNKLIYNSEYTVKLTNEIEAYDKDQLESNYQFSFSTMAIPKPVLFFPTNNSVITETSPTLDWNEIDGALGYHLQVNTSPDFSSNNLVDLDNINSSQFQISSPLENNTVYYWRVKARTIGDIWSEWSNVGNFNVELSIVRYPTPGNHYYIKDPTPLLDWEDVDETSAYHLQVNDASDFSGNMIIDFNNLDSSKHQSNSVFSDNNDYYWRVKRKNNDDVWSDWSIIWEFKLRMEIPDLISPYNSATLLEGKPLLTWTDVTDAMYYHLQLSTEEDFTSNIIVDDSSLVNNQFQIINELPTDSRYFWRVRVKHQDNIWSRWTLDHHFNIPRLDIQTDLLFYYPLNGNTLDYSGNGNDAIANGLVLTTDRNGNPNSAYKFNSNGDYLEMPPVRPIADSAWTYSLWCQFDVVPSPGLVNDAFLFSYKEVLFDDDVYLYVDDVDARIKAYLGTVGQSGVSTIITNRKISTNYDAQQDIWIHLCVTHHPDPGRIKIYINGESFATSSDKFGTTFLPNTPYLISCISVFDDQRGRFFGSTDEIHFFGRDLNQYEVEMLYNKR